MSGKKSVVTMDTLEERFDDERVFVFGAGGSGDVIGSIPTARLLESHGVEVVLGGMAWEPVPTDMRAGPRRVDDLSYAEMVAEGVALVTGESRTSDGLRFTESLVAEYYDEPVVLLGLHGGPAALRRGIEALCDDLDIDGVVGVDAGGDVLASGSEPGLRSPLTDGYALSALAVADVESCLGVIGYGSDGELTIDELESAIGRIAAAGGLLGAWGVTQAVRRELEPLLEIVDTEASRLPVEAARGELGERTIRGGEVELDVRSPASVTFYFDPAIVADQSDVATRIRELESLEEATKALGVAGYTTEFEIEARRLERLDR